MKERIRKNLQINLLLTITNGILVFVSNKYFNEYLGIEKLGLMKLFTQLIAYLSLAELGIGSAATFALYKPISEKKYDEINLVVSTINWFYKKISVVILIIGLLANVVIPLLIDTNISRKMIHIYWTLYVINTSITYMFAKYSILFTANQEYGFVRKVSGLTALFFQIIQIIFLIFIPSFLLYIFISILNNLVCFYFYKRHFRNSYSYIKKVSEKDKDIIKNVKNMFYHKVAGLIVSNTDYIVLAKFTNLSIIAIYSSYLTVYMMAVMVIGIITSVITPLIGRFIATNKKEDIYSYWEKLYSLYMFLGVVLILSIYRLINYFIILWLGEDYLLPKYTILLIMINLFISVTRGVTDLFKECSGFFEDIYTPVCESILNLLISLILVKKIGLDGVIIGTLCSNVIIVYIYKPILVFRRCFSKKGLDYLKKLAFYILLIFLVAILSEELIQLLNLKLKILNWREFIKFMLSITTLITVVSFLIFMLDSNFRKFILKMIKEN